MNRGEIWLAQIGAKTRPVLILTRPEVLDVRRLVTVAEITTSIRGLSVEVELDSGESGLDQASAVNCDGLHTIRQSSLTGRIGAADNFTMSKVCQAVAYALGC